MISSVAYLFKFVYIGFDIGGSRVKAVLADGAKIVKSKVVDLPKELEALLELISQVRREFEIGVEISGVGFALAAIMDKNRQEVLKAPNIKYLDGQPIYDLLEKTAQPYPIKLEHDTHCFLLAEKKVGLAKNLESVFCLTLGTGIGGAWLNEGKIIFGAHGAAGEAGHALLEAEKELDLEDMASNKFIKKQLGFGSVTALERAQQGDKKAMEVFRQLGKNLGIGLADIINICDPQAIILAGGIAGAKEYILPAAQESLEKFVMSKDAKKTPILFSEMSDLGGALGAIFLFDQQNLA